MVGKAVLALSDQIRAARALLRLDQEEVASRAHVPVLAIRRLEADGGEAEVAPATVAGVRRVLEEAGIEFVPNGILKRRTQAETEAMFAALKAISRQSAAELRGRVLLTDDDLYDENGLPA